MGKPLPDDLNTLRVSDLKEALKERGLTTVGNKADLVARLQGHVDKQATKVITSSYTPNSSHHRFLRL